MWGCERCCARHAWADTDTHTHPPHPHIFNLTTAKRHDPHTKYLDLEGEKFTSLGTHFRQDVLHTPDLALVAQAELTAQLQLGIDALLLKGAAGTLPVTGKVAVVTHGDQPEEG